MKKVCCFLSLLMLAGIAIGEDIGALVWERDFVSATNNLHTAIANIGIPEPVTLCVTNNLAYNSSLVDCTVEANATLGTAGTWPEGAPAFCRISCAGAYTVGSTLELIGYASWPSSGSVFQAVVWRIGAIYYVNIVKVE